MLIDGENEVYFFDRDHNIFRVEGLRFLYKKNLQVHLTNTLIDGVSVFFMEEIFWPNTVYTANIVP